MATKKADTDNATRTTSDDLVNAPNNDKVNKTEINPNQEPKNQASKIVHTITGEGSGVRKDASGEDIDFVPTGTKSTPLDLLEQARAAAESLDKRDAEEKEHRRDYTNSSKAEGRDVLKYMLRFVESFKDGSGSVEREALDRFLDTHAGKPHGSAKSPYQRISKYCAVNDTAKALVSKRAYALDAIVSRNIHSSELDAHFDKKEKVGPSKVLRSGMQKYILLYELDHGGAKDPLEKYEKMKADRLIGDMLDMLSVLHKRQMLPDSLVADAKKRLDAELQKAA